MGADEINSVFSVLTDFGNSALRIIATFLESIIKERPRLPKGVWEVILLGTTWNYMEVFSVALTCLIIMTLPLFIRRIKAMLYALIACLVVIFLGGKIFDLFFALMDLSEVLVRVVSSWSSQKMFGVVTEFGGTAMVVQLLGVGASLYYVAYISVLYYVLVLLTVIFMVAFMPLFLLSFVWGLAKAAFDNLLTIGIMSLLIAAPILLAIIALGKFANELLGGNGQPVAAAITIVASLALAKKFLVRGLKGTHAYVKSKTESMTGNVRGRVETHWRNRPKMDVERIRQDQAIRMVPSASAAPSSMGLPRLIATGVLSDRALRMAGKIAASSTPIARAGGVALHVVGRRLRKKAGV